ARDAATAGHSQPALPWRCPARSGARCSRVGRDRRRRGRRRSRGRTFHTFGPVWRGTPMSGISGLLPFDGPRVARRDLERAANALNQYGPDRVEIIAKDNCGFAHALMRMTPEDRFDCQPSQDASGAIITADLRLDNRDDLIARVGIPPQEATQWPDSRLLLTAWQKLGDDIWPGIPGPFAVAVWDPRSRCMTLARDHLGLNVVTWHKGQGFFAFASLPNALFALDNVPRELCEEKLADFLVLNHADHATTMYRNVFRVPP